MTTKTLVPPSGATSVEPLTVPQILALPALVPVWPTTGAALGGLGRTTVYQLAREGRLPFPTLRLGRALMVRRADILNFLGLAEDGNGARAATPDAACQNDQLHQL